MINDEGRIFGYQLPDGSYACVVWDATHRYGFCKYLNNPTVIHFVSISDVAEWRMVHAGLL